MSAEVLVVKNIARESPGLLHDVMKSHGVSYDVVAHTDDIPSLDNYGAMLVFGGPQSVNDNSPEMNAELATIDTAVERGMPYFGICLGMQALAKIAGGDVVKDDAIEEIGFADEDNRYYEVELTEDGANDPLFEGLPEVFQTFHLHGEGVAVNGSVTQLASGKICPVQAIKVGGSAYGMQSHLELTREMLMLWGLEDPHLQYIGQGTLLAQYNAIDHEYTRNGTRMFENFLQVAGVLE